MKKLKKLLIYALCITPLSLVVIIHPNNDWLFSGLFATTFILGAEGYYYGFKK